MTPTDGEKALFEEAMSAHREIHRGRIRPSPAWFDLPPQERERLFHETEGLRALEAAMSPDGMDTTARRVLGMLRGKTR